MATRGAVSRPLAMVIAVVYIVLFGLAVQQLVQNQAAMQRARRSRSRLKRLRGR